MVNPTQQDQRFQTGLPGVSEGDQNRPSDSVIPPKFAHRFAALGILCPSNYKLTWYPECRRKQQHLAKLNTKNTIAHHLLRPPAHLNSPTCNGLSPVTGGGALARSSFSNSESLRCLLALPISHGDSSISQSEVPLASSASRPKTHLLSGAD